MKILNVLLVLVMWGSLLHGEDFQEQAKRAESYFLGKEFNKSAEVYEEILQEELSSAQRSVVYYNLGSVYLEQKNWDRALNCFQEVSVEEDSPLPLLKGLFSNMTLLNIRQADELLRALDEEDPSFKGQLQKAMVMVSEGLKFFEEAVEVDNQLAFIEGREVGEISEVLLRMKKVLKKLRAALLQRKHDFELANMTFDQGINFLKEFSRKGVERLEDLGIAPLDKELKQRLMSYLIFEGEESDAIWSSVRGKFMRKDSEEQELHEGLENLFVEAESKNAVAMDLLREGRLWEGRNALLHSGETLHMIDKEFSPVSYISRLLQNRVVVFHKLEEVEDEGYKKSLEEEDETLRTLITFVGKALSQELGKSGGDIDSKVSRKQLDRFLEELLDDRGDIEALLRQQVFFTQIFAKEEEVLLVLYDRIKLALNREESKKNKMKLLDEIAWSFEFLKEKFHEHYQVDEDSNRKDRIKDVLSALNYQKNNDELSELRNMKASVDEALRKWAPKALLSKKIENLLFEFSAALESMKSIKFEKLSDDIKGAMALVAELREGEEYLWTKLENDLSYLLQSTEWSQRVFEEGKIVSPRLFLEDALHWIKRAAVHLQDEEPTAVKVLKMALEEQGVAKKENDAVAALNEKVGHELTMMTRQVQETVLDDVSGFLSLLLKIPDDKKASLPLEEIQNDFDKGLENAENAKKSLQENVPRRAETSQFQDQARLHWEEALKKLQNHDDEPENSQEQGEQEEQGDGTGDSESQNENKQVSAASSKTVPQDVLQLLQEMQRDDKVRPKRKMVPKRGLRPW